MTKETREVELPRGWKATICRPSLATWFRWEETVAPDRNGRPVVIESGREVPPSEPAASVPASVLAEFMERKMIPECVIKWTAPDGVSRPPYLPDLGFRAFGVLANAIVQMVNDAVLEEPPREPAAGA